MAFLKLPEIDRRNVHDVVIENFKKVNLKNYAIRMIYIGEHTLSKEETIKHFHKTVQGVQAGYLDVPLFGLLLVYDSYFVHILEGSEDTVHRQLRFLFQLERDWIEEMEKLDNETETEEVAVEGLAEILKEETETVKPERKIFRRLKLLMVYHSITTRLFDNWKAMTARPPSLVGTLDVYAPLPQHMEQLRVCLDKIQKLCMLATTEEGLSFEGLSANDPKTDALPEVALLDFLLTSQYILDLRQNAALHRRVDDYVFYFEEVWPLPTHFTPRLLYKLKIDDSFVEPLPVMPWEIKQKEEDEEKEDQRSGSSGSD